MPSTPYAPPRRHAAATALRRWIVVTVVELSLALAVLCGVPSIASARSPTYSAPLPPRATVVRGFDPPDQRWESGHRGVDFAAAPGTIVLAAADGVIRFAGNVGGKSSVSILHGDGLITTYEPVQPIAKKGARVARGDPIATVASAHPGCPVHSCLHWGARRGVGHAATYVNPLGLLGAIRVRLKPVDG
ncbi:MAG: M23 family metallopeptidase [Gordonia sp. (in: high G+C Gram-positive bacteria)]